MSFRNVTESLGIFGAFFLMMSVSACGGDDPKPTTTTQDAEVDGGVSEDTTPEDSGTATEDTTTVSEDTGPEDTGPEDTGPELPDCTKATEGCGCDQGACGKASDGELLTCVKDTCVREGCSPGANGCPCGQGACTIATDVCSNGYCQAADCSPGSQNCRCLMGSCGSGFVCQADAICVDATGSEGGKCFSDNTCKSGKLCDAVQNRCIHCDLGNEGCQPSGDICSKGLVVINGLCSPASNLPPKSPKCYSPCVTNVDLTGGGSAPCIDGLFEGCKDPKTCKEGECLAAGETRKSCKVDSECFDWQVCIQNNCYSNCDANADCAAGQACHRHACRQQCTSSSATTSCPAGTQCVGDGTLGFCLAQPVTSPVTAPGTIGQPKFTVTKTKLLMSNVAPKLGFQIMLSNANAARVFTVRKMKHRRNLKPNDDVVEGPGREPKSQAIIPCTLGKNCPLMWVTMGAGIKSEKGEVLKVTVPANCLRECAEGKKACPDLCPTIMVETDPKAAGAARWTGILEVALEGAAATTLVSLGYSERPDGQWSGTVHYFGSFANDSGKLSAHSKKWASSYNALIRKWHEFRNGSFNGAEFHDAITSVTEETWKLPGISKKCQSQGGAKSCYPRRESDLYGVWVDGQTSAEVPSGVAQLPFAMNLQVDPADPMGFAGRVDSNLALQYPGFPAVALRFESDPAKPTTSGSAYVFLDHTVKAGQTAVANSLFVGVGRRFTPAAGGVCPTGFKAAEIPWLIPGFLDMTKPGSGGALVRTECRDSKLPLADATQNTNLSRANPTPDGMPLNRTITFLDGVLVDQATLYLLFREEFESFVPRMNPLPASAYGVVILKRSVTSLAPSDYQGLEKKILERKNTKLTGVTCSPDLLKTLELEKAPVDERVQKLIDGSASADAKEITKTDHIHWVCEDTGLLDGGPNHKGSSTSDELIPCPVTSKITYFYAPSLTQSSAALKSCNQGYKEDAKGVVVTKGGCVKTLNDWVKNQQQIDTTAVFVKCAKSDEVFCDDTKRLDMRLNKKFYVNAKSSSLPIKALHSLIGDSFRYKTRFQSSTGGKVGFSPIICGPSSATEIPYCYQPKEIIEARERLNCLIDIGTSDQYSKLSAPNKAKIDKFLTANFAEWPPTLDVNNQKDPAVWTDGFERLYAELLVNLGDDALTAAYASRFDLAGVNTATFLGANFETGGINLTGVAGNEFYKLYQATQYYQLALDRMYSLGTNIGAALDGVAIGKSVTTPASKFVTPKTVTMYLERLTRAATQKALAWNEIAKRYHGLQKSDLAKRVLRRAYVATYLEGALIAQLMNDIIANADSTYQDGLRKTMGKTQLRFRSTLSDMRDAYEQLNIGADIFGYPADFVPFPALEQSGTLSNAFTSLAEVAKIKMAAALIREKEALESNISGKVDAVTFQTELVGIKNTYENQLADICGTFTGDDGSVYAATKKYADKSKVMALSGDPCGRVPNGDIREAVLRIQTAAQDIRLADVRYRNLDKEISDEITRVAANCDVTKAVAENGLKLGQQAANLTENRESDQADLDAARGYVEAASTAAQIASGACSGSPFPGVACAVNVGVGVAIAAGQAILVSQQSQLTSKYIKKQKSLDNKQAFQAYLDQTLICKTSNNDQIAKINGISRQKQELILEVLKAAIGAQTSMSQLNSLKNQATRLQAQQAQAESLQIDFAAAKNDPNVRLYQNDSVIEADIFYRDALRAAFAATRAFEYFTSQSYKKKQDLYLARMVGTGQKNLQDYMLGLENAYLEYQQQFGTPDIRVISLSLRDDILNIPYELLMKDAKGKVKTYPNGVPMTKTLVLSERTALLREKLKDQDLYDSSGYLSLPFATRTTDLSPLTRNHKIHHIQVDIQGSGLGDNLGRVYLRMLGTGSILRLDDNTSFYALPQRTAVVNAIMGGVKYYAPEVYDSYHLRDRPLTNTLWQLVINQRDEKINQDIKLEGISDILLHIYYTDVTKF